MSGPADEIKSRLSIVDLVGETVKLRRSGRSFVGLCPFHAHTKNTPSFVVWPETGTWRCFGQCNEGGDIFKFVMKKEGWQFRDALEHLAQRAGVELKPRTPQDVEREEEYKRLRDLLNLAVTYYRNLLVNAPQAQLAREHLQKRGLTQQTLETFELGYALPMWEAAQKFFLERKFTHKEMLDAGLLVERDDGSLRDRFRNRLMIPIRDGQGRIVGFGARALDPNDQPKFLNSPQTPLFNKGETVYALDRARKAIATTGVAVLVEGYMDVMAAHQANFTNVVSAMGTALTETQLRLIKKFSKRIVLALDADVAGDKATLRGLNVARETSVVDDAPVIRDARGVLIDLDARERIYRRTFDARGIIRSESKINADVRVFELPAGLDPDEVVNKNPDDWKRGVEKAEPIVDYVMRALTVGRDLDDPKTKSDVADEILPIIDDVADPIERDAYRQKLARLLKIDERALIQKTLTRERKLAARPAKPQPLTAPAPSSAADADSGLRGDHKLLSEAIIDRLESYCLSALVRHPDLVAKADRQLRLLSLTPLSSDDFTHTDLQIIFNSLRLALDQHKIDPHEHVELNLDELLQSRLQTLLDDADEVMLDDRQRIEDILFAVIRLRDRNVDAALNEMRFLQEDADEEMGNVYNMQVHALVQAKQKLTQARKRYTKRMERVVDLKADEESN